jgi:hypothetical protein
MGAFCAIPPLKPCFLDAAFNAVGFDHRRAIQMFAAAREF